MGRIAVLLSLALVGLTTGGARADFVNGNFESGNFNGWTVYLTTNGKFETPATVTSFDTTGAGSSLAARLQVGQDLFVNGVYAGGGLSQSLALAAGAYHFEIDLASQLPPSVSFNGSAGKFELIVDGTVRASHDFGQIVGQSPERQHLEADLNLSAGSHEFRLQWTRPFQTSSNVPFQYMDNASLTADAQAVPGPGGAVLFALGLVTLAGGRLTRRRVPMA
jgi:hypothetical protein